jgi:hypothetical protein
MRRFPTLFGLVVVLGLALGAGQAQAQTTVNLSESNISFTGSPPWEIVTLTQISSTQVQFDWKTNPANGSTNTLNSVSFNGPSGDTIVTTPTSTAPTSWSLSTSNTQADGFGSFGYQYGNGGNNDSVSEVVFTVQNTNGLTIAQLLGSFSTQGQSSTKVNFAAHYFPNGVTTGTGWVANAVPEPGPFLGAGVVTLIGMAYSWRRRRATS